MSPPSILFVVYQSSARSNGGVKSIGLLIQALDQFRPIVLTNFTSDWTMHLRAEGVEVLIVPSELWNASFFSQGLFKTIRDLMAFSVVVCDNSRREKVRLVVVNDPRSFWLSLFPSVLLKLKRIIFLRDTFATSYKVRSRYWLIFQLTAKQVVLSFEMKEFWSQAIKSKFKRLTPRINMTVLPSIVEQTQNHQEADEIGATFKIGVIGAFSDKKNQLEFIKNALPTLKDRIERLQIIFLGDFRPKEREYDSNCEVLVRQLGVEDRVTFVGFSDTPDRWIKDFALTVIASRNEGMARAMLESLAHGKPVVSFNVASAGEILDQNRCGIVVKQGDYMGLVDAIEQLAGDPQLRFSMGQNGLEYVVNNHSKSTVGEKFSELIRVTVN